MLIDSANRRSEVAHVAVGPIVVDGLASPNAEVVAPLVDGVSTIEMAGWVNAVNDSAGALARRPDSSEAHDETIPSINRSGATTRRTTIVRERLKRLDITAR